MHTLCFTSIYQKEGQLLRLPVYYPEQVVLPKRGLVPRGANSFRVYPYKMVCTRSYFP